MRSSQLLRSEPARGASDGVLDQRLARGARRLGLALALLATVCQGCSYTILSSREEMKVGNQRVVGRGERYEIDNVSLSEDTLVMAVSQRCYEEREGQRQRVAIETRQPDTEAAVWITGGVGLSLASIFGGLALMAASDADFAESSSDGFFGDPEEHQEDADFYGTLALSTLGVTALGVIGLLIAGGTDYEHEHVLERDEATSETVDVGCGGGPWPERGVALIASKLGLHYDARHRGGGRYEVSLVDAPLSFWDADAEIQLAMGAAGASWVDVALPAAVISAGRERFGEAQLELVLGFDDSGARGGDSDGQLDAGEQAALSWEVTNHGQSTARGVVLELTSAGLERVRVDAPVTVGDIQPGATRSGQVVLVADAALEDAVATVDGSLRGAGDARGAATTQVTLAAAAPAARVHVWYQARSRSQRELLEAGAMRLQSVLTNTREYVFVTDTDTRARLQQIVDAGGGHPEDRRRRALDAARQENVSRVFEFALREVGGVPVQLEMTVYDTGGANRLFIETTEIEASDVAATLKQFEALARAYLAWSRR